MAITDVKQIRQGARAGSGGDGQSRTYRYHAYSDSTTDSPEIALADARIPKRGSSVITPSGHVLRVKERYAEHVDGTPELFLVTIECGRPSPMDDPEEESGPVAEPWGVEVTIDGLPFEEMVTTDRDDRPLLNSAGMPYPEGLIKTYHDRLITISFRSTEPYLDAVDAALGKINSDAVVLNIHGVVRTYDPHKLLLTKGRTRTVVGSADVPYWQNDYEMHYRVQGTWQRRVVNRGFHAYNVVGGERGYICEKVDGTGLEVVIGETGRRRVVEAPAYLTADGTILAAGATVSLKNFWIEEEAPFAPLFEGL